MISREDRIRLRYGFGIGRYEYSNENIYQVRELMTELLSSEKYIGYFDTWEDTLRVFVLEDSEAAARMLREARSIGFESAGMVDGIIAVSNSQLQRPHLKHLRRSYNYYKEYYR